MPNYISTDFYQNAVVNAETAALNYAGDYLVNFISDNFPVVGMILNLDNLSIDGINPEFFASCCGSNFDIINQCLSACGSFRSSCVNQIKEQESTCQSSCSSACNSCCNSCVTAVKSCHTQVKKAWESDADVKKKQCESSCSSACGGCSNSCNATVQSYDGGIDNIKKLTNSTCGGSCFDVLPKKLLSTVKNTI